MVNNTITTPWSDNSYTFIATLDPSAKRSLLSALCITSSSRDNDIDREQECDFVNRDTLSRPLFKTLTVLLVYIR